MSLLRTNLSELIQRATEEFSVKKTRFLLNAGVDPSQFSQAIKGDRPFSDTILEQLASSKEFQAFGITAETLKGWRAMDEYSPKELLEAVKALPEAERKAFIKEVLGE